MGKSCSAIDCKNRFNKKSNISFYRLPKAKEKRTKWIDALCRNNWNPGSETWICSCHFVSGMVNVYFILPLFYQEVSLRSKISFTRETWPW